MHIQHLFHRVRKRSVAHVVKQGCGAHGRAIFRTDCVPVAEAIQDARDEMQCSETVSETRMLSSLISVEAETELLDPSESLELCGVDQANHHSTLRGIFTKRNDVVNRIAVNTLGQFRSRTCPEISLAFYHSTVRSQLM